MAFPVEKLSVDASIDDRNKEDVSPDKKKNLPPCGFQKIRIELFQIQRVVVVEGVTEIPDANCSQHGTHRQTPGLPAFEPTVDGEDQNGDGTEPKGHGKIHCHKNGIQVALLKKPGVRDGGYGIVHGELFVGCGHLESTEASHPRLFRKWGPSIGILGNAKDLLTERVCSIGRHVGVGGQWVFRWEGMVYSRGRGFSLRGYASLLAQVRPLNKL